MSNADTEPATFAAPPTQSVLAPAGAPPISPAGPPAFVQTGPQTYVMTSGHRRRRPMPAWLTVGLALAAGLVLAAPLAGLALRAHGESLGIPHTATAAEAKQACKSAIEEEAQARS